MLEGILAIVGGLLLMGLGIVVLMLIVFIGLAGPGVGGNPDGGPPPPPPEHPDR